MITKLLVRSREKPDWDLVLQSHIGILAAGDHSQLVESAAHLVRGRHDGGSEKFDVTNHVVGGQYIVE